MTEGMSLHVSPLSFKGKIHLNCDLIWEYPRDQVWGEISERVDSFVRPFSRERPPFLFLPRNADPLRVRARSALSIGSIGSKFRRIFQADI